MSNLSEASPARLAIVGTDLKFITPLVPRLERSDFEVRVDEWPKFRSHDEQQTREVLDWASIVLCEWAGPNAVIASRTKRPGQRLIVRLHRMELGHPEWRDIDIDAVDLIVTVGPYYRRRVLETTGWPEEKVVVVPNFVDVTAFDRPKTTGASHHLGMIGGASSRKRLDLAVDVLAELRRHDARFRLFVKGPSPWGLKWVEDRPEEVKYFAAIKHRLDDDPLLEGAVVFDPPGPDVAEWLENVGFLLSTSDDESFHLSPAEGMASRAVPVIRPWPGADEIYDPRWVVDGKEAMAARIIDVSSDTREWSSVGETARLEVMSRYDIDDIVPRWVDEVLDSGHLRVGVVSTRNPYNDPSVMTLIRSLDSIGHEVTVVSGASPPFQLLHRVKTRRVASPTAPRFSLQWWARKLGRSSDEAERELALGDTLARSLPQLIYPHRAEDIAIADSVTAPVARMPNWPEPLRDLISLAPHSPELSASPTTPRRHRRALPQWEPYTPAQGRHGGKQAVIVYRVTPTSPGRYLEAALRRSGMDVMVVDGELDWGQVSPETDLVVFVESAYPAMRVTGSKPAVPTFFWVHHGEHHLAANLRLTRRYRADAVLMAHSWHLAHRFPVPTFRFPFGVATELDPSPRPWRDRRLDVAMVGSGIGGRGSRYDRRREIAESLTSDEAITAEVAYGLPPEEMIALYGNARIVVNDGGPRHFPITMRVFETLAAGALLLTEDIPGTDTILSRGDHYVPMAADVASQVRALLADDTSSAIADAGHSWAVARHTYDHRVDHLTALARETPVSDSGEYVSLPRTRLGALIDQDVEVQHLAVFGDPGDLALEDRAVRAGDASLPERSIDGVAIGEGPVEHLRDAVLAARGYVYAVAGNADQVARILAQERPEASVESVNGMLRADIGGSPYRMRPADHPLSS